MNTASLLTDFETCARKGVWARSYQPQRLISSRMTLEAIRTAIVAETAQDWGELAGSEVLQLAEDRGLDTDTPRLYDSVCHHAAMADILVSSIRKPEDQPWLIPERVQNWTSGCFLSPDGSTLRRIILASHWTDARHYAECRSWPTMGEIATYNLPMQLVVFIVGQQRDGRRSSPWVSGFLHPQNHQLRFRKKSRSTSEVFSDKWEKIYREDHGEISRETWLQAMLTDDVLPEVLFRVDVPIPDKLQLNRIRDLANRKMDRLYSIKEIPEANLSTCDFPTPCVFRGCCHVIPERKPSEKNGFIPS